VTGSRGFPEWRVIYILGLSTKEGEQVACESAPGNIGLMAHRHESFKSYYS
jgi:hypothetical protein